MPAERTPEYLAGVRDAFEAIYRVGGAGILQAMNELGLSVQDLNSPRFLLHLQARLERAEKDRQEFLSKMAPDYEQRRHL